MVSRVLVAMDGSEMAERALEHAIEAYEGADVTVLTVVGEPSVMWSKATALALANDIEEAADERAAPVLERARAIAEEHGVEIEAEVGLGAPAREILDRAPAFDVVVLGSHGGGLTDRLIVGNVASKVFRHSPVPVTVVR